MKFTTKAKMSFIATLEEKTSSKWISLDINVKIERDLKMVITAGWRGKMCHGEKRWSG